ncbi:MAG TPA: hypothetical protein VGQ14_03380 [Candidatus Eisenbacteria bacterium]|nr:hypothetical protein [Candidatus Eisenbacteria bacterium]
MPFAQRRTKRDKIRRYKSQVMRPAGAIRVEVVDSRTVDVPPINLAAFFGVGLGWSSDVGSPSGIGPGPG